MNFQKNCDQGKKSVIEIQNRQFNIFQQKSPKKIYLSYLFSISFPFSYDYSEGQNII